MRSATKECVFLNILEIESDLIDEANDHETNLDFDDDLNSDLNRASNSGLDNNASRQDNTDPAFDLDNLTVDDLDFVLGEDKQSTTDAPLVAEFDESLDDRNLTITPKTSQDGKSDALETSLDDDPFELDLSTDSKVSSKTSVNNDLTSEIATDKTATTTSPTTRSTESDTLLTEKNFDTASQLDDLFAQVDDASMDLNDKKVDNEDVIRFDDNTDLDAIDIDLEDEPLRFDDETPLDDENFVDDDASADAELLIDEALQNNATDDIQNESVNDDGILFDDEPVADNATVDEPIVDEPIIDESVVHKPLANDVIIEDSADDNSSSDNVNADDSLNTNTPNQAITTDLDNAETDEPAGDNLKANFEAVNQNFSEFRQQMKLLANQADEFYAISSSLIAKIRDLQNQGDDDFSITYEQVYQLRGCMMATKRAFNEIPNFFDVAEQAWENDLYTAQMRQKKK